MSEDINVKLQLILDYQALDRKCRILNDEIEKSEAVKKQEYFKNEFNNAKAALESFEQKAEAILQNFEKAQVYIEENELKFDTLKENPDDEDIEQQRKLLKNLESLKAKFTDAEKKINENIFNAEKVLKGYIDANERGKKMRVGHSQAKIEYEKIIAQKRPEADELRSKMNQIKSKLEPKILSEYESLANDGKFPPVVIASTSDNAKSFSCGGCGLSQSQKNNLVLRDENICHCENCRRILYYIPKKK